jgi:hypothetical protein
MFEDISVSSPVLKQGDTHHNFSCLACEMISPRLDHKIDHSERRWRSLCRTCVKSFYGIPLLSECVSIPVLQNRAFQKVTPSKFIIITLLTSKPEIEPRATLQTRLPL